MIDADGYNPDWDDPMFDTAEPEHDDSVLCCPCESERRAEEACNFGLVVEPGAWEENEIDPF